MRSEKKVIVAILIVIAVFYVVVVLPWIIGTPLTSGTLEEEEGGKRNGDDDGERRTPVKVVEPNDLLQMAKRHEVDSVQQQRETTKDQITQQPGGNEPAIKRRNMFTPAPTTQKENDSDHHDDHKNIKGNIFQQQEGETPLTSSTICDATTGFHDDEEEIKVGIQNGAADFKVKAIPGGTEEEALSQRRQLLANNKPGTPAGSMRWRPAPRQPLPAALTSCMAPKKMRKSSSNTITSHNGNEDLLARAIFSCIGDTANHDEAEKRDLMRLWPRASIACLVRFYTSEQARRADSVPMTSRCSNTYGEGLFKEFAKANPWKRCERRDGGSGSNVVCKSVLTHFSHSDPTSVCSANNVVVDYTRMLDGDYPWLSFQRGALQAYSCQENSLPPSAGRGGADGMFMHCLADWMKLGYLSNGDAASLSSICSNPASTDNTPTLFLTRSGDFSPFAIVHDAINALILYGIAEVNLEKVQVVVMDRMGMGFYSPLMQLLLSPTKPLKWLPDLRREKKCYTQAYFNIPARLSPIYNQDDCEDAPLYAVLSDLMQLVSGYQLQKYHNDDTYINVDAEASKSQEEPLLAGSVPDVVTITVITRKNYATGHSIGRRIQNHNDLVMALRRQITPASISGSQGKIVEAVAPRAIVIRNIDYALWDFDQQIGISASTDVLVAMHGAGLVQSIFLPRYSGGVFEIFCPEKPSSNYRYQQLSAKLGIRYDSMEITNEGNVVDIAAAVRQIRVLASSAWKRKREMYKI